jgi:4-hydroxybenzoyl-CoA thioesterase
MEFDMLLSRPEAGEFASERREEVVSRRPFVVRRVARWSECDPAGVVYSGNFAEYALSAMHLFRRHAFDATWRQIREHAGVDMPAKAISLVFNGSLWPDDVFDMEVRVGEIRTRTFDFEIAATRADDGSSVFTGTLGVICVTAADRRIAAPIPDALRRCLDEAKAASLVS